MRNCPDLDSHTSNHDRRRSFRRHSSGASLVVWTCALLALTCGGEVPRTFAQPPMEGGVGMEPAAPYTNIGGGEFFSQELGTLLRLRYNTRSYGQNEEGNLDIGTMQVVNFSDAIGFFDGQLTLNDANGAGYNLGLGFRWLDYVPFLFEPERITGVSVWADGMHTEAGNFFPQVGVTYESLGDMWDLRVNGYVPVGPRTQVGEFEPTGETGFIGNTISELTQAAQDTAIDVAELEVARRLGAERDAWAFGGGYVLNDGDQDATGYRVGLRGYAYPDLMLQLAVSDDDMFKTNASFMVIWFVGRTRTDYQPTCGLPDRFREPVLRNDYVALSLETVNGGIPLTEPDGDPLRVVHVNSAAPDGGDGTFENPLNDLAEIEGNSQPNDIVLGWSQSVFNQQGPAVLQDNQRFWGEGDGVVFTVATNVGTIQLPETSPGARDRARPIILEALGNAVTLADANEVRNFTIDGNFTNTSGIIAGADGAGSPILNDLAIQNMTGDGINLTPFVREDEDGDETVAFSVNISDVQFSNITGDDIELNADTSVDVTSPDVTLNEAIVINNVTSTGNVGVGLNISNTHATGTVTVTDWSYTEGTAATLFTNFNSALTMSESTVENITGGGIDIAGDSDGSFTFNGTNTFAEIAGVDFEIGGTFTGSISMQDDIDNTLDRSIVIQGMDEGATATFSGDIVDSGEGILIANNNEGVIQFTAAGSLDMDTTMSNAVTIMDNAEDVTITFAGLVDIVTTTGNAFTATDGGTLGVTGNANTITTTSGTGLTITDMTIATGGANFADFNATAGATSAILLEDNTGGAITVGLTSDEVGEAGEITGRTDDAIVITNSSNVSITGLRINNTAGVSGVRVTKNTAGIQITNLNDLEINDGNIGVEVVGNGTGTLNMTLNDSDVNESTAFGLSVSDIDAGTSTINSTTFDGGDGPAAGVLIANSNATFSFNADSEVLDYDGNAFEVDGGTANVNMAGDITNSVGQSIVVENKTGGTVTFTGAVADTGGGIRINDNSGGTVNVTGETTLTTDANVDAVVLDDNTGSNINFGDLTITASGTGRGFVATDGGTLGVSGTTNTITSATGTGLTITGMTIAAGGVNFQSVDVNGAANGIILTNLTGGQVAIGDAIGDPDEGGELTTTGEAIVLSNVANVDLNNIHVVSSGLVGVNIDHTNGATTNMDVTINGLNLDSSTGVGIDVDGADSSNTFSLRLLDSVIDEQVTMDITANSAFLLLVDDTQITTAGTDVAMDINFSGSAQMGDITIRNNSRFEAANASALEFTANGTNIDIEMRIDDVEFQNASNAAGSETAEFDISGGATVDATIVNNSFLNSGSAVEFSMTSDGTATRTNLDLNNNTAGGAGTYELNTVNPPVGGFNFGVVDRDQADANNIGSIDFNPIFTDFEDIDGPLPQPTVP